MKYCSAGRVSLSSLPEVAPVVLRVAAPGPGPLLPLSAVHSASTSTTTALVVNMVTTDVRSRLARRWHAACAGGGPASPQHTI